MEWWRLSKKLRLLEGNEEQSKDEEARIPLKQIIFSNFEVRKPRINMMVSTTRESQKKQSAGGDPHSLALPSAVAGGRSPMVHNYASDQRH